MYFLHIKTSKLDKHTPLAKLRILVFSNRRNFDDEKKYTYTCLHWHHDLVMDLAFSVTGKYKFKT